MPAKYCFILAAGLGSRMGEIGKRIPKPLFPFYERTLLDLQIQYALDLNPDQIFINTHHLGDQIISYVKNMYGQMNITVLNETVLLDVGGGIHNVANIVGHNGELIVLNSDVLYLLSPRDHGQFFNERLFNQVKLLALKVKQGAQYNEIKVNHQGNFLGVSGPNKTNDYLTYSGVCRINLSLLEHDVGISSFFQTVAKPNGGTQVFSPSSSNEYWDFGTKELYWKNTLKIFSSISKREISMMNSFLIKKEMVSTDNLVLTSYTSENENFSVNLLGKIICLSKGPSMTLRSGIYYQELFEAIDDLSPQAV